MEKYSIENVRMGVRNVKYYIIIFVKWVQKVYPVPGLIWYQSEPKVALCVNPTPRVPRTWSRLNLTPRVPRTWS